MVMTDNVDSTVGVRGWLAFSRSYPTNGPKNGPKNWFYLLTRSGPPVHGDSTACLRRCIFLAALVLITDLFQQYSSFAIGSYCIVYPTSKRERQFRIIVQFEKCVHPVRLRGPRFIATALEPVQDCVACIQLWVWAGSSPKSTELLGNILLLHVLAIEQCTQKQERELSILFWSSALSWTQPTIYWDSQRRGSCCHFGCKILVFVLF